MGQTAARPKTRRTPRPTIVGLVLVIFAVTVGIVVDRSASPSGTTGPGAVRV
ncbi:hypothetical protein BTZ20_0137 [Rhodococcus sp. MTM3W5.2]|nr:hypothetical protein BTZ20_0137 [Rhodococcus sp. MTM3W5.2]